MARTLYLFKKCKPNLGNNTHYFGTGAQLRALLVANAAFYVGSFTENSYRIETGHVKLQAQLSNYNAITYIIDEDTETGYFKAYHVSNNSVVGGYVDFSVQVDLWGSNIFLADFSKIHVSRCNRNIGHGWYDEVPQSAIDPTNYYEPIIYNSSKLSKAEALYSFCVFFIADCVISQNLLGQDAITARRIYAMPLDLFFTIAESTQPASGGKGYKPVEIAAAIVSGIYKYVASSPRDYSVQVRSIFIAPYNLKPRYYDKFESVSMFDTRQPEAYICDAFIEPLTYAVPTTDIQYEYYVGAGLNAKPLKRYIDAGDCLLQYIFTVSQNGLKVILRQGNHDDDITDAFMLPITNNAQQTDMLAKIAFGVNFAFSMAGNVKKLVEGEYFAGISGTAGQLTSLIGSGGASPASLAGQGDAVTTFGWTIPSADPPYTDPTDPSQTITPTAAEMSNPFTCFKFKSLRDENEHARLNGANFDKYVSSFASIANMNLLGSGTLTDTYAVVDSVEIEGVQEEAEQFIKGELSRGVYYVVL